MIAVQAWVAGGVAVCLALGAAGAIGFNWWDNRKGRT